MIQFIGEAEKAKVMADKRLFSAVSAPIAMF